MSEKIPFSGWYNDFPAVSTMDDVRIEKWIDQLEANEAARNDRRKGRQKIRKVDKKRERESSQIHGQWPFMLEGNTSRRDIIDDVDEQIEDEPNSITVTGLAE